MSIYNIMYTTSTFLILIYNLLFYNLLLLLLLTKLPYLVFMIIIRKLKPRQHSNNENNLWVLSYHFNDKNLV